MSQFRGYGWAFAYLVVACALLWPAATNGRAAYFFDTAGYHANGRAAVAAIESKLQRLGLLSAATRTAASVDAPTDARSVVAIRAVAYAAFVYLGEWPAGRMVAVIIIQALLASGILMIWWRRVAPDTGWPAAMTAGLATAAFTSASWFTSFVMPDIFAGLALLAFLVLAVPAERPLSLRVKLFLCVVIGYAFAAHVSHVPLIVGLSGLAIGLVIWTSVRRREPPNVGAILWLGAPVGIGVVAVLATSVVGFSEVSLAPKRMPLVLARSIADGPARWYLQDHCATEKYVICDLFPVIPTRVEDVLFGPNGLRARATPEQMEAIRREEPIIVARAARAYPLHQAAKAAAAFGRQLLRFDLTDTTFTRQVVRAADGEISFAPAAERAQVRGIANLVTYAGIAAALIYLAMIARRLRRGEGTVLLLLAAGLLGNAAVTGILSGVAHRYQGRIIWVVPVVALGFYLARRASRRAEISRQFTGALPAPAGTLKALDQAARD